jgi:hypothetical protein
LRFNTTDTRRDFFAVYMQSVWHRAEKPQYPRRRGFRPHTRLNPAKVLQAPGSVYASNEESNMLICGTDPLEDPAEVQSRERGQSRSSAGHQGKKRIFVD